MASQVGDLAKVTLQLGTLKSCPLWGSGEQKVDQLVEVATELLLANHEEGFSKTGTQGPGGGALTPKCTHGRDLRTTTISMNLQSGKSPRPSH